MAKKASTTKKTAGTRPASSPAKSGPIANIKVGKSGNKRPAKGLSVEPTGTKRGQAKSGKAAGYKAKTGPTVSAKSTTGSKKKK